MIEITLWGDFAHQLNEDQFLNNENNLAKVFAAMIITRFMGTHMKIRHNFHIYSNLKKTLIIVLSCPLQTNFSLLHTQHQELQLSPHFQMHTY